MLGELKLQVSVAEDEQFRTVFELVLNHSLHVILAEVNQVEAVVLGQQRKDAVGSCCIDVTNARLRKRKVKSEECRVKNEQTKDKRPHNVELLIY